jgi:tetratricopeptide (TPR) repeat protein
MSGRGVVDRWGTWAALLLLNLAVLPLAVQGIHAPDTDMFYHLASGRFTMQHGQILDREIFSFTIPDRPWTNYSWLFQYALAGVYERGGFVGLIALRAILVLLTANLLFYWCWRRAAGDRLVALGTALLVVGIYGVRAYSIRPHLIDYLFLVVAMILLDRLWRRPGSLEPWLPLLCVAWASLHGVEYPILLMAVAVHGLAALLPRAREPLGALARDRDVWRWPALFVLCAAAFALNPFGVRVFATALMGLDDDAIRHLQEFQPLPWRALLDLAPDLSLSPTSLAASATVFVLAALPQWLRRRDARALLLCGMTGALALSRARFLLEFALLVLPFAGEALAVLRREPDLRARLGTAVVAGVGALVLVAIGVNAWTALRQGRYTPLSATAYPIGPVRFLDGARIHGNFFVDADASGYVEWALSPHVRVFMDLRTPEPFDGETLWLYRQVAFATDVGPLARVEARWPLDGVLLRRQAGLGRALARDQTDPFDLVYADDQFVLFLHQRVLGQRKTIPPLRVLDPFDTTVGYVAGLPSAAQDTLRAEVALLLRVWPANHLAHQTDLALLAQAGDPARTYERASRLIAEFPGEARYPYAAGMALRALDRDAAAFEAFQRALRFDPAFGVAAVAAAETALRLGRHDDGRAIMERELGRRRDRLGAAEYRLLADLRYRSGRLHEAVRAYERALWLPADDRSRAEVENNLGSAYLDLGMPGRGLGHLEAALARVPGFPEAELNRARAWAHTGRTAEARREFRRLAEDSGVPAEVRARARARLAEAGPAE